MPGIQRRAEAVWTGSLRDGNGRIGSSSGVLKDTPYSFGTRFKDAPGTNPEELIAAAHAACFSMAFADTLGREGYSPARLHTTATVTLVRKEMEGFQITKSRLEVTGKVPDIDESTFQQIAVQAERACPVSNALRALEIELQATLE